MLFGLVALLVSCQRESHVVRRPWSGAADLELVDHDGTTMPARRFVPGSDPLVISLGAVSRGDVLLHAALEGPKGGKAEIDLDSSGTGSACVVTSDERKWQECVLPISQPMEEVRLRVRTTMSRDARVVLSSPLIRSVEASKRPTVIVILVDTLRFDRLKTYAPDIPLGIHLDELARDGVVFDRAHSSSSWTRAAVATLLTGLDAGAHGVLDRMDALAPGVDSLPQALQRAGYRTLAWSTNANILPVWGFAAGFDSFHDLGALDWPKEKMHAGAVFAAIEEALGDPRLDPALLYVHLMDPHYPYRPEQRDLDAVASDPRLAATFPAPDRKDSVVEGDYRKYLAEIRGMDRALGDFLEDLSDRGLYDDAMILVVADHGEEFRDHGGIRHGHTLYEEVLRVPVVLKLPGNVLAGTRLRGDIGMADLAPTLLGVLGVNGLKDVDGRNLWNAEKRALRDESAAQVAILKLDSRHQASLIAGWHKLIVDYRGKEQLFDLEADSRETRDLLERSEGESTALRSLLEGRIARRETGWHLRVCGGDRDGSLALLIRAHGDARAVQLEKEDDLRLVTRHGEQAEYRAALTLPPRKVPRQFAGGVVETVLQDEDEVTVPMSAGQSGSITAASDGGSAIRFALGTSDQTTESNEIEVSASDPLARISPHEVPTCRPSIPAGEESPGRTSNATPYVRIWFSPPSERRAAPDLDPTVRERLRALGYAW